MHDFLLIVERGLLGDLQQSCVWIKDATLHPRAYSERVLGWSVTTYLLLYLRIIIHEIGHWSTRAVSGVKTETVRFGSGGRITPRFFGVVEFHWLPFGGGNLPLSICNQQLSKSRKMMIYSAGMVFNAVGALLYLHSVLWIMINVFAIYLDIQFEINWRTGFLSDGAALYLIRKNKTFPLAFDPCGQEQNLRDGKEQSGRSVDIQ